MSRKRDKTLEAVFSDPVPANLRWRDIEALFVSLGGEIIEGRGSRVTVFLGSEKATFHRPHPHPETDKGAVRAVRRFLVQAGLRPKSDRQQAEGP